MNTACAHECVPRPEIFKHYGISLYLGTINFIDARSVMRIIFILPCAVIHIVYHSLKVSILLRCHHNCQGNLLTLPATGTFMSDHRLYFV